MPVYQSEAFLADAIESILSQTYTDFELLAITDPSPDRSEEIVTEFSRKDPRVRGIANTQGKGIVGALNTGLKEARGDLIARMDSDDRSVPDRLAKQVAFLTSHPDIGLVGAGYAPFNENGVRLIILHPETSIEIAWKTLFDSFFCHPAVMFRRSIVDEIGPYPQQSAEDYAFFSKLVSKSPCWNLQEVLLEYREHTQNLSVTKRAQVEASVRETSTRNFQRIFGSTAHYDIVRRYVILGEVRLGTAPILLKALTQFCARVQAEYKIHIPPSQMAAFYLKNVGFITRRAARGLLN